MSISNSILYGNASLKKKSNSLNPLQLLPTSSSTPYLTTEAYQDGIISFVTTLIIGLFIYTFLAKEMKIGCIIFAVIVFACGLVWYKIHRKSSKSVSPVFFGMGTGFLLWIYIFIGVINKEKIRDDYSTAEFVFKTDGYAVPLLGWKDDYHYQPPESRVSNLIKAITGATPPAPAIIPFVPADKIPCDIQTQFTLTFWLRVWYKVAILPEYSHKSNVVLVKPYSSSNLFKVSLPALSNNQHTQQPLVNKTNVVHIYAQTDRETPVSIEYPFDTWVQYSVVVDGNFAEVYTNGLLESTMIMSKSIMLNQAQNMYIGEDNLLANKHFPGELYLVIYYNRVLTAAEINSNYQEQRNLMAELDNPTSFPERVLQADCACPGDPLAPVNTPVADEDEDSVQNRLSSAQDTANNAAASIQNRLSSAQDSANEVQNRLASVQSGANDMVNSIKSRLSFMSSTTNNVNEEFINSVDDKLFMAF